jgi:DNA mismatch endonuclease (patch repair protein)
MYSAIENLLSIALINKNICIFAIMDVLTPLQRHNNMASIRSANTKPEILVRKYLWRQGFRYRLNNPRLPGHPDIVLRKYRTCVFVNGCFWHGHDGCKYFRLPKTNTNFWEKKINRNKEREKEEQRQLAKMGWHCITVWKCELKPDKRDKTLKSLAFTLNHIYLEDRSVCYKSLEEESGYNMAAEPEIIK